MSTDSRSQKLKDKLAGIALLHTSKKLQDLLSSVEGMKWMGYSEDTETPFPPSSFWQRIIKIDAEPSAKIPKETADEELLLWLMECFQQLNSGSSCYLSIGGLNQLPWAKVQINERSDWLLTLWNKGVREFIILSADQSSMLGVTQEEYYYFAYLEAL